MSAHHLRQGNGRNSVNDLSIHLGVFPRLTVPSFFFGSMHLLRPYGQRICDTAEQRERYGEIRRLWCGHSERSGCVSFISEIMEGVAVACGITNVTISPAVRIPFRVLLFPGAHSVLIPF